MFPNVIDSLGFVRGSRAMARGAGLLLIPFGSAVLLKGSFPPYDLGFLVWFGLAPFLFALRQSTPLICASLSFLFGWMLCIFGPFSWFAGLPKITNAIFTIGSFTFSVYFLVFGVLYRLLSRKLGSWLLWGAPFLWVTVEYIRANLFFLAFPFNLLGHSQYRYLPIIQIASITGVYGVSFLLVLVNQFLSQLPDLFFHQRKIPDKVGNPTPHTIAFFQFLAVAFLLIITLVYGFRTLATQDYERTIRIALIQANVVVREKMSARDQAKHLHAYELLTKEAVKFAPDLVVWPSTSLPAPPSFSRVVKRTIRRITSESGTHLLVGGAGGAKFGPRQDGYLPYSNSEFLISPSGRVVGQYNKIRLVPFNEYLPLQEYVTWPQWFTNLGESFTAGSEMTLFEVSGARFGTLICFENMFPDLFRRFVKQGADFMVSVTNEAFCGDSPCPYQTLSSNVFRAVENQVAIARAATTGVSAFIAPTGEIVARIRDQKTGNDLFVPGFLVQPLPLSTSNTFYTVYGDVFAYVSAFFAVLLLLGPFIKTHLGRIGFESERLK